MLLYGRDDREDRTSWYAWFSVSLYLRHFSSYTRAWSSLSVHGLRFLGIYSLLVFTNIISLETYRHVGVSEETFDSTATGEVGAGNLQLDRFVSCFPSGYLRSKPDLKLYIIT